VMAMLLSKTSQMHRNRYLRASLTAIVILAMVTVCRITDPYSGSHHHSHWDALPVAGSLAILPSDPIAWLTPQESPAVRRDVLARALPPRAPPV
jgi:hypothetical protein